MNILIFPNWRTMNATKPTESQFRASVEAQLRPVDADRFGRPTTLPAKPTMDPARKLEINYGRK